MRRYWEERRPPSMFSVTLLLRLASGIGMLVLIALLIVRIGEPGMWRWLAGGAGPPPAKRQTVPPPISPATGPTDEDPDQAEMAREEFQALTDGSLELRREEMEPYYRLVFWVKDQSYERLRRRAQKGLIYTNFYDSPDKYRGKLAALDLDVRQVLDAGKGRDGTQLYELRGFTANSWGRPYFLIVIDLPKGMPVGPSVHDQVKFAGYFLKLQGYIPAEAKPGAPIEMAPLLIGRIEWKPPVAAPVEESREWIWWVAGLAVVGVVLAVRFLYWKLKPRRPAPVKTVSPGGEALSIESWLDNPNLNIDEGKSNDDDGISGPADEELDEE